MGGLFKPRTAGRASLVVLSSAITVVLSACGGGSSGGSGLTDGGGGSLSCTGNRVWTSGASELDPRFEDLISEGGGNLGVPASSATPCAVVWLYDASAGCSLGFSVEQFFTDVAQVQVPSPLSVRTSGANLVTTAGTDTDTYTPSGISLQQLTSAPDC